MSNLVFLDTEFSHIGVAPKLISIALVSIKNDESFYAELPQESYLPSCSPWVRENVLPLLEGGECVMPIGVLRTRLFNWISVQAASRVVIDHPKFDMAFLQDILDPWPSFLEPTPIHLSLAAVCRSHPQEMQEFCDARYTPEHPQHHALNDAIALRQIWRIARRVPKRERKPNQDGKQL